MSLPYDISSPLKISSSGQSEIQVSNASNSVNIKPPSVLSTTYDFILPQNNGVQNQILSLNPSLETQWIDNIPGSIISFIENEQATYSNTNTANFVTINGMTVTTPPAGTYYCEFNSTGIISNGESLNYALFVGGTIINDSSRFAQLTSIFNPALVTLYTSNRITVNGSQDISVRAILSNNGNYNIFERTLFILKIG